MGVNVTRTSQSFVVPCAPTANGGDLPLSVVERDPPILHMVRSLHVFRTGERPAAVIKGALSKALVKYYPLAGRFVDPGTSDVRVVCTGEGVWFVEATASCSLEDLNYLQDSPLLIPKDDLLPQPPEELDPICVPLMMQVTEFTCGGFVIGLSSNHAMTDGIGAAQFLRAIGEMARGLPEPTVEPIWSRDAVVPNPPRDRREAPLQLPSFELQSATVDVSPDYISGVKNQYVERMGRWCSTFDVVAAKIWQSRIRATSAELRTDADVHLCFFADTRRFLRHVLPPEGGYYGNCIYPMSVAAPGREMLASELTDVVEMIRDARARLPEEFAKWEAGKLKAADPFELTFSYDTVYVTDWRGLGLQEVDYGWGTPMHVVPFPAVGFMESCHITPSPTAKGGVRLTTQCVEKEHLETFLREMNTQLF